MYDSDGDNNNFIKKFGDKKRNAIDLMHTDRANKWIKEKPSFTRTK